ncbi:hypothetical protein GOD54_21380 [Sinorhizobium medicae]|nr:hypothetical protein [Sinorhizobium medicae]
MSNQRVTGELPSAEAKIFEAARWLSEHREECTGRFIPALKERFGLRNIEAVQALNLARELHRGRAAR